MAVAVSQTYEMSKPPKLSKFELKIMDALWNRGPCSIREIYETFPAKGRPGFTTVQTTVYRMEAKNALRRFKRISNANIFEAVISRGDAQNKLIDDLISLFGGSSQPVMARLVESGSLSMEDVEQAREALRKRGEKR